MMQRHTQVRREIETIVRFYRVNYGAYIPPRRRSYVHTDESLALTITLYGESLGSGPAAEYQGPHGHWVAKLNPKGVGKPYQITRQEVNT